ncbi:MAG TPA: hypothetical protein VGC54_12765 [Planctomycetota bacterium]
MRALLPLLGTLVASLGPVVSPGGQEPAAASLTGPYAGGSESPANRLHAALFARDVPGTGSSGLDSLDALRWTSSKWPFAPARLARTRAALRAVATDAESLPPIARALLQREIWAFSDWLLDNLAGPIGLAPEERAARESLVRDGAIAMQALALSAAAIDALPDNLTATLAAKTLPSAPPAAGARTPWLPPGLADPKSEWLVLSSREWTDEPIAGIHNQPFSGRSVFTVHLRHAAGKEAAHAATQPFVEDGLFGFELGPEVPPLPPGSTVAFVRRMVLVDRDHQMRRTPLVESVQLRHFLRVDAPPDPNDHAAFLAEFQQVAELELDRATLLDSSKGPAAGLRAVGPHEKRYIQVQSHGLDPIEEMEHFPGDWRPQRERLETCMICHGRAGAASINLFTSVRFRRDLNSTLGHNPLIAIVEGSAAQETAVVSRWKRGRADFGWLQGAWSMLAGSAAVRTPR